MLCCLTLGVYEIIATFHLLCKMASNKVQSELGGRVVRCSRRTPRDQTEQIRSQQQPSVVLKEPWATN